jgi:hypothetical protein
VPVFAIRGGELEQIQFLLGRVSVQTTISATRTTPQFPTPNHTDPAVKFNGGLFEAFNAAGGSVMSAYGNLFQVRQNVTWANGRHVIKAGGEIRANRDTTCFGIRPTGSMTLGEGPPIPP